MALWIHVRFLLVDIHSFHKFTLTYICSFHTGQEKCLRFCINHNDLLTGPLSHPPFSVSQLFARCSFYTHWPLSPFLLFSLVSSLQFLSLLKASFDDTNFIIPVICPADLVFVWMGHCCHKRLYKWVSLNSKSVIQCWPCFFQGWGQGVGWENVTGIGSKLWVSSKSLHVCLPWCPDWRTSCYLGYCSWRNHLFP